jgi:hypothetical protein
VADGHRQDAGREARHYVRQTLTGTLHTAKSRSRRQALLCCVLHSFGLRGSQPSYASISPDLRTGVTQRTSTSPSHELIPDRAGTCCTVPFDQCSIWHAHYSPSRLCCPAAVVSPCMSDERPYLELHAVKHRGERGRGIALCCLARLSPGPVASPRADPAQQTRRAQTHSGSRRSEGILRLGLGLIALGLRAAQPEHK